MYWVVLEVVYSHSVIINQSLGMYQEIHLWRVIEIDDSAYIHPSLVTMEEV